MGSKRLLIKNLKDANIIKRGDFLLKSGKRSAFYVDFRGIIKKPFLFSQ